MMLFGSHRINRGQFDASICEQIVNSGGLIVGTRTTYGSGIYAYYPDKIPHSFRNDPFVVFQVLRDGRGIDIKDFHILGFPNADTRFFILPRHPNMQGSVVKVAILGFINCPNFPTYPGTLTFV